jgi:hypothetical protein
MTAWMISPLVVNPLNDGVAGPPAGHPPDTTMMTDKALSPAGVTWSAGHKPFGFCPISSHPVGA